MKNFLNVAKFSAVSLITASVIGCGSETDSSKLARELELEKLRATGTIIETVNIQNNQVRLKAGETHQLSATGIDSNGDTRDITNELTWKISDDTVARISASGLLTALKNSEATQGLITVTATTINDIFEEEQISISDTPASSIELKQILPSEGAINTCIPAEISADITYEDDYVALNSTRGISFSLDANSTAEINEQGIIYTSSANIEKTTITGKIDNISGELVITSDPSNLKKIELLHNKEAIDELNFNVGERIQLTAQATYDESVSSKPVNINSSIKWSVINADFVGLTEKNSVNDDSSTILALKPGVTQLIGSCGNKQEIVTLVIDGNAELNSIQINNGTEEYEISQTETLDLQLFANYTSNTEPLNVTEFADWSLNNSSLITAELINLGTNKATYRITSNSNAVGTAVISVAYDSEISTILVNIK